MTFNEWFLSLPEQRQAILRNDKWMLAQAAFDAWREHGFEPTTTKGHVSGIVEVCPECDIAGCHHIRARQTHNAEVSGAGNEDFAD